MKVGFTKSNGRFFWVAHSSQIKNRPLKELIPNSHRPINGDKTECPRTWDELKGCFFYTCEIVRVQ